jgi:hypothetical protein
VSRRKEPTEDERLAEIRAKHTAHHALKQEDVTLLLQVLERLRAQIAQHPVKRLYAEAKETLESTTRRVAWREDLLRVVAKELRRLAAQTAMNASDRRGLARRADRIEKRLQQRDPPEGWSATGIPGEESRSDPE